MRRQRCVSVGWPLCTRVYLRASSQHFAGHLFVQFSWPGCANVYLWSDQNSSTARLSLIDFSTWTARINSRKLLGELAGPAPEVKVTQSGVWLFVYPSSEACLEAEGWEHCWMKNPKLSQVSHLQWLWTCVKKNTTANSDWIITFCNY